MTRGTITETSKASRIYRNIRIIVYLLFESVSSFKLDNESNKYKQTYIYERTVCCP